MNDDIPNIEDYKHLLGKTYSFEDGDSLEIIQIKRRDDGPWITYNVQQGPGIPRKLVMFAPEFVNMYGHLFGLTD